MISPKMLGTEKTKNPWEMILLERRSDEFALLTLNSLKVLDITEYRVCRYNVLEYNSYTQSNLLFMI